MHITQSKKSYYQKIIKLCKARNWTCYPNNQQVYSTITAVYITTVYMTTAYLAVLSALCKTECIRL